MRRLINYINLRFPVSGALLFAFGYILLAIGAIEGQRIWIDNFFKTFLIFLALVSNFFFFLLRTRVVDEFKDSQHDKKNFWDRPFVSGAISKKELILIGTVAFSFEIISVVILGFTNLLYYLPLFIYSLLMSKEFFVSRWLNDHFNIYFLSHEFIFIFFGFFYFQILRPMGTTASLFSSLTILFMAPMLIELVRKFSKRFSPNGKEVKDTYCSVWGRNTTLFLMIVLAMFISLFLTFEKGSMIFTYVATVCILIFVHSVKTKDSIAKIGGLLTFLILALISNLL